MKHLSLFFTILFLSTSFIFSSFGQNPSQEKSPKLPSNLRWETNDSDPEFSSPDAKKGGTVRFYIPSFPVTLRTYGPDSLDYFASYTRGVGSWYMTHIHPNTGKPIPFLATHWAYGTNHKTIYFRLNKNAKWSDGRPITADDYLFSLEFLKSKFIVDPGTNDAVEEYFERIEKYDDYTIGIIGKKAVPKEEMHYLYTLAPMPRHFYKLDKNFVKDYNWKFAPTAGPYVFSKVNKGKSVTMKRVTNWWAKDLKYFKNRYNPDFIQLTVIRDQNIAFEHFKKHEIDFFPMNNFPDFWHVRSTGPLFDNGYIHKLQFYNNKVRPSYSLWLNMRVKPLDDLNVRLGIAHALNFEKLFKTVLRGDAQRRHSYYADAQGYTNKKIRAYPFDTKKAMEYFSKAGYKERGADGIFVKDGKKLAFELLYGSAQTTEWYVLLKEEAKMAGLELNLKVLDPTTFFKIVMEGKHEIASLAWHLTMPPFYEHSFHSKNADHNPSNNITNTKDPKLDKLIDDYNNEFTIEKKYKLAQSIEELIHTESSAIPMHYVPFARETYWRWIKFPKIPGTMSIDNISEIFPTAGVEAGALFWIDEETKKETLSAMKDDKKFEATTITDETYKTK